MYYAIDSFFWYKALFMAELLAAELLLACRLPFRRHWPLRMVIGFLICFGTAFALPCTNNPLLATLLFFAMFVLSFIVIFVCCRVDWRTALFCAIVGYTTQHIANQTFDLFLFASGIAGSDPAAAPSAGSGILEWLPIMTYGSGQGSLGGNVFVLIFYFGIYIGIYVWMHILFKIFIGKQQELTIRNFSLICITIVIVLFDIVFSSVVTWYARDNIDRGYIVMLDIYNIACCIFVLYMQFNAVFVKHLEENLTVVNRLFEEQKKQYSLTKENIDIINIKCHDMKHQIRKIGRQSALPQESIDRIEDVISIYDSAIRTGNVALDIILTEKSLFCNHNKIVFSCIADGKALNFLSETDIYSLFGNLLDNAIEAVRKLPEGKRIIGLKVKQIGKGAFLNIYNTYQGDINFDGKLPRTTKEDKIIHGYGLKSIEMIVQQHEGELTVEVKDGIFNVSIVFPDQNAD